ncbi:hypothetical protein BGX27_002015 [Mortierella sp. AM989]|nr:hypothetical protein BGX27_002015 [Mortierella sp. AM989]
MAIFSDEEIEWINNELDKSPELYFEKFDISDKQRGHIRYIRLIQSSDMNEHDQKVLFNEFETWKRDKGPQFWLRRRARIAAIDTAASLVEGSVPFAEDAIQQNAAATSVRLENTSVQFGRDHTSSSVPNGGNATSVSSQSAEAKSSRNILESVTIPRMKVTQLVSLDNRNQNDAGPNVLSGLKRMQRDALNSNEHWPRKSHRHQYDEVNVSDDELSHLVDLSGDELFGEGTTLEEIPHTPPRHAQEFADEVPLVDDDVATFKHVDITESFTLNEDDQNLYNEAVAWFKSKIKRNVDLTLEELRKERFKNPWVHDLLYDRVKLLRTGINLNCDENTYTSFWIMPDFFALHTGVQGLIAFGYANENHFKPSSWRRTLSRKVESAKGTNVDGYFVAQDNYIDIIFENVGDPQCTDHAKHNRDKSKCWRNSADALLERFYNSTGSYTVAKKYRVISVVVFGMNVTVYSTSILDGGSYEVSKIYQSSYHTNQNAYIVNLLMHLRLCLVIKTLMERNQDISLEFSISIESTPKEEQAHNNLHIHSSPEALIKPFRSTSASLGSMIQGPESPIRIQLKIGKGRILSPTTAASLFTTRFAAVIADRIRNHPSFRFLSDDLTFLDGLTRSEEGRAKAVFKDLVQSNQEPNPDWRNEVDEVQPWVRFLYSELAGIFQLTVNRETRRGGSHGEIYADHYLTYPEWTL